MKTPIADLTDFAALDPFFRIIETGTGRPGRARPLLRPPRRRHHRRVRGDGSRLPAARRGRTAIAELYRPYGTMIVVDRCFDLAVYHDAVKGVAVLEYASHGHAVATGNPYHNQFISVLTLRDREVVHWRDYLDPVAVFDALGWPQR